MNDEALDRAALNDSGLGFCSSCKTICKLDAMVSEPSRKNRRRCKACHAQRMSSKNREKALQYAVEAQKRGGPPLLSAPLLPQKVLPINPKLDQLSAV